MNFTLSWAGSSNSVFLIYIRLNYFASIELSSGESSMHKVTELDINNCVKLYWKSEEYVCVLWREANMINVLADTYTDSSTNQCGYWPGLHLTPNTISIEQGTE